MSTRTQRTTCITCHGKDLRAYREAQGAGETFHLVRCADCRTVFVADPLALQPTTAEGPRPASSPALPLAGTFRPGHAYLFAGLRAHLERAATAQAPVRVLEVGAGWGEMGLLLGEAFGDRLRYTGIEPAQEHSAVAAARGLDLRPTTIAQEMARTPAGSYDLVIIDNVLEHLLDPGEALRSVAAALAPRGALVVAVPNLNDVRRLYPSLYRRRYLWIPHKHVNYFTWSTLRAILAANGLEARLLHPPLSGSWRRRLAWGAKALAERLLGLSPRGLYAIATPVP